MDARRFSGALILGCALTACASGRTAVSANPGTSSPLDRIQPNRATEENSAARTPVSGAQSQWGAGDTSTAGTGPNPTGGNPTPGATIPIFPGGTPFGTSPNKPKPKPAPAPR